MRRIVKLSRLERELRAAQQAAQAAGEHKIVEQLDEPLEDIVDRMRNLQSVVDGRTVWELVGSAG